MREISNILMILRDQAQLSLEQLTLSLMVVETSQKLWQKSLMTNLNFTDAVPIKSAWADVKEFLCEKTLSMQKMKMQGL